MGKTNEDLAVAIWGFASIRSRGISRTTIVLFNNARGRLIAE